MELTAEQLKQKILELIASATLADNMGDMWDDLNKVAEDIGEKDLVEDYDELPKKLYQRDIKTVWGSEVWSDEDEE